MSLFFITFFLAYGGMHLYAFLRARAALHFGLFSSLAISFFMLVMLLAPLLIRQAEKQGLEEFARMFSLFGYMWLGILFLFSSSSLMIDLYRFLIRSAELVRRADYANLKPSAGVLFYLPLIVSLLVAAYGYGEARNIRTEKITIRTPKISKVLGKIRIVQISDVHLGLIIRDERLSSMLKLVQEAAPDLLVSTGDLVDGQINGMPGLAELFNGINPRYGKFAITGNHEFYAGLDQALAFTRKSGFRVLRNEALDIEGILNIAGVDDRAVGPRSVVGDGIEQEMLSRLSKERFTLFLKHRPLFDKGSAGLFDLQLSGHVHRGQIFPFSILTKLYYPVHAGFVRLDRGSRLYVSRGTGTWGPPIRFLSPPEITVIDLVHGESE
ncbi:MAG: metallophosphoesterase [Nitrospirae bacterium]|nr:metallophosphoesterase [Nitrospirota bacterium]